jgi:pyrimidine operon attenuation protein/uracil phosphoribosyltransferase
MQNQTLILNNLQIEQKISRIAWQIYEDNSGEAEIILAGILSSGYSVAEKIAAELNKISAIKISLISVKINKHSQYDEEVLISSDTASLKNKTVCLVDDVLNSGKTMMYALRPFLAADLKKLRTVVLVDRNHKRYPVSADFAGLTMATTLQDHISVVLNDSSGGVFLG